MQGTGALLVRLVFSMGVVLGLMALAAALVRRSKGLGGMVRRTALPVNVVASYPLTRAASVSVVRAGQRALVLGVTDAHVTLLHDAAIEDLEIDAPEAPRTTPSTAPEDGGQSRPWKDIVATMRERTVRRP